MLSLATHQLGGLQIKRSNCGPAFMVVIALSGLAVTLPAQSITCRVLRTSDRDYSGRCWRDNTTITLLVLQAPPNPLAGRWLGTQARVFGRGADSADVVDWSAFGPTFADIGQPDSTYNWCWCRITRFTLDSVSLVFEADPRRPVSASIEDVAIIQHVRAYLSDPRQWNRNSDRNRAIAYCPPDPESHTLFCALYDAARLVRGAYFPGAAIGAIQSAISATSPRRYQHALDGFNNDSLIDHQLLQRMLEDAERRVRSSLAARGGG